MWQIFQDKHMQQPDDGIVSAYASVARVFTPTITVLRNIDAVRQYAVDMNYNELCTVYDEPWHVARFNTYQTDVDIDYDVDIVMLTRNLFAIAIHDGISDVRTGYSMYQVARTTIEDRFADNVFGSKHRYGIDHNAQSSGKTYRDYDPDRNHALRKVFRIQ